MRLASKIMSLPAAILLLISSHSNSALAIEDDQAPVQWPYNLPKHVKYWPEDPPNRRRDLEAIEEHLRLGRNPVGVMKMPADEGEKFYPEYWQFEGELGPSVMDTSTSHLRIRDEEEEAILQANTSAEILYRPPFALHTEHESNSGGYQDLRARKALEHRGAAAAPGILEKKQFACPNGTSDCSSIGYPNSCCATDETCFVIQDTGLGPVGCCPNGSSCGGTITNCNAPNTACADNLGGGCCIPNYVCAGVGCVINPTLVVTVIQTLTIAGPTSSTTMVQISTSTITTLVAPVTSTITSTYTGLQTTLLCSSNFQACPVTLGGGCCPADRICASQNSCALSPGSSETTTSTSLVIVTTGTTTSIATGVAPARPTGATSATTSTITTVGTSCPTGFYACSAYYAGGCCRTGRNCDTTSCPVTSSETIISGGVTVVVPVGTAATVASPVGNCATGWSTCDPSLGGDCCPSGWGCGTASCTSLSGAATEVLQKGSPNTGVRTARGTVGAWIGVLMVALIMLCCEF